MLVPKLPRSALPKLLPRRWWLPCEPTAERLNEGLGSYGFLAPPTLFIVLCLLGALVAPLWHRAGLAIVLPSSLFLFVAATPAFCSYLTRYLEARIPKNSNVTEAQA